MLVGDALDHLQQHRGIVDMLGIGRHRGGQRLLLLAALLVALVEQLAQLWVAAQHARIEMARQRLAVFFQDGRGGLDQRADFGAQHTAVPSMWLRKIKTFIYSTSFKRPVSRAVCGPAPGRRK
ncbi:Uncharacterised protein [Bordetella pertussis]|nr:Uncharacterised protein [Bordetella pertussis]